NWPNRSNPESNPQNPAARRSQPVAPRNKSKRVSKFTKKSPGMPSASLKCRSYWVNSPSSAWEPSSPSLHISPTSTFTLLDSRGIALIELTEKFPPVFFFFLSDIRVYFLDVYTYRHCQILFSFFFVFFFKILTLF